MGRGLIFLLALGTGPAMASDAGIRSAVGSTSGIVVVTPDLVATSAFLRTETGNDGTIVATPAAGQRVFFYLRFRAEGFGDSVGVTVRATLDGETFCSSEASIPGDGTYVAFCSDAWTATAGPHALEWEAEPSTLVEESRTNNTVARFWNTGANSDVEATRAFLRTGANSGAEVIQPTVGEEVYFHLRRRDVDLPPGATFVVRAELDGETFCTGSFAPRNGAANAWCVQGWTATGGTHTLRWTVDAADQIAEIDEGNNAVTLNLSPQSPSTPSMPPSTSTPDLPDTPTAPLPTSTPPQPRFQTAPDVIGDCDADRRVAINELVTGVRIALGDLSITLCPVFDPDRSFSVSIAELIRAVNVALKGAPAFVPPPDVILQVIPGAVLLDAGRDGAALRVEAYRSDGAGVDTVDLDIEWISSDPDSIAVEADPLDPATATVTVLDSICSTTVFARLRDHPQIVSDPVAISRAKLHPEVDLLPDERVVFPPPNLPRGVDLEEVDIPERDPTGGPAGEASYGGFGESEIAALLGAGDDFTVRYPVIVRGAPPAVGQRWLASGGASVAGFVVDVERRGDFSLVQVELAPLPELFEEVDFSISAEALVDDGLLQPVDIADWGETGDDSPAATSGLFEFSVGPFLCKPPSPTSIRPTFTQEPVASSGYFGPIWDGSLRMSGFSVEEFFFKIGFEARAFFNPELRITPGIQVVLTCDLKDEHRKRQIFPLNGPFALVLAPYLEGFPSTSMTVNVSGGPTARFGANIGFDYAYWAGGTYTEAEGWQALCQSWEECSRTNEDARLIWAVDSDFDQITMEGDLGVFGALEAGVAGAGGLLAVLDRLPVGPLLDGAVDSVLEKMRIRILRARVGPRLNTRWHNAKRTAFLEASEGAANVVVAGDVVLTLDALNTYIQTALKLQEVRNIPLLEFNAAHIVEPYRLLREETITVNGERASSEPIEVGRGQEVSIVSTVERDFLNLTLIQIFLTRVSPHEEFPHLGELWLDGDPIAELTPLNSFTLAGSFSATPGICDAAEQNGGSLPIQILAFNRMFSYIPTANFVGKFSIACTENLAPTADAGPDQTVELPEAAMLQATVEDDGQPDPPGAVTVQWSATGPGSVSFANRASPQTTATFGAPGVYQLTLTADDGELSAQDSLTVTVEEMDGDATPPALSAAPCGGIVSPGDTVRLSVEATDETAMDRLVISIPRGYAVQTTQTRSCAPATAPCRADFDVELRDPLPPGAFTVDVEAFDAAGNRAARSCTYRRMDGPGIPFAARKIVDSNTVAPGTDATFRTISRFVQHGGNVVFQAVADGINLYGDFGSGVEIVADERTVMPEPFDGVSNCTFGPSFAFSLEGQVLAFETGGTCNSTFDHVFFLDTPARVPGTPAGMRGFSLFNFFRPEDTTTPEISAGRIEFVGLSGDSIGLGVELPRNGDFDDDSDGLFILDRDQPPRAPPGPSVNVVDVFTPIPGGTGTFLEIRETSFENGTFAFVGGGADDHEGVYMAPDGGAVEVLADTNTPVPGGTGTFTRFCGASIDGDAVAFEARGAPGEWGTYVARNGTIEVVADRTTTIPGRQDEFTRFSCDIAFDDGRIVFLGSHEITSIGGGLFVWEGGVLRRVIERGDVLDGEPVRRMSLGTMPDMAVDGTDLALSVTSEGQAPRTALFVVTLSP